MIDAAVELRPIEEGDFAPLVVIAAEDGVERWWGPNDEASLREEVADKEVTGFAIVVDGELAGLITVFEENEPGHNYVEADLFLGEGHQDKGVGTEALRLAMRWAFDRGHHRAVIYPAAENARAIRCYEKVGFKPVGIFRKADRGRDSLGMDLLKEELT